MYELQRLYIHVLAATVQLNCMIVVLQVPWVGLPLKYILLVGIFLPSILNAISALIIILTEGKGKNGSTVAVSHCVLFISCFTIQFCLFWSLKLTSYQQQSCFWINLSID